MNMKKTILLLSLLAAVPGQAASLAGLWAFDDPADLAKATVGTPLTFGGTAPGAYSASLADDGGASLPGVVITPAAAPANQFIATHGIAPNGGGAFVNQYSILVDLFTPAASRSAWRAIMQTSSSNADDGDYFIRNSDDALGVGALTYSANPIDETRWNRLVVTFDLGNAVTTYLNGSLFHTHNASTVDGRFALNPTVLFFSDEDGENASLNVGSLAIFNGALTPSEVSALGQAGAAVPEPSGTLLSLTALLGLAARRRRA